MTMTTTTATTEEPEAERWAGGIVGKVELWWHQGGYPVAPHDEHLDARTFAGKRTALVLMPRVDGWGAQ